MQSDELCPENECPECGSILDSDGKVMEGAGCWWCGGVNEDDDERYADVEDG